MADQASVNYVFALPNSPEQISVPLAPAELRKLDFSALDFDSMRRACVEYIRTYFPSDFNDWYASNGVVMMLELTSYIGNILSERSDILVSEAFLPTATTTTAVSQHLALIGQQIQRATAASVDVQITIQNPIASEVQISAGTSFSFTGPNSTKLYYEIFRAPGDYSSVISIPPGKRGIIAYGIQGVTASQLSFVSQGGPNQYYDIQDNGILDDPFVVTVVTGEQNVVWQRVDVLDAAGANDTVYELLYLGDYIRVMFGNDIAGKAPLSGQTILVNYRTGDGASGRITAGIINENRYVTPQPPASAPIQVNFTNPTPSVGGTDQEAIEHAKERAPKQYATHNSAISGEDYGFLASQYSHPYYGSIAKAISVVRTGVDGNGLDMNDYMLNLVRQIKASPTDAAGVTLLQNNFINRNIIELYVLAEGPDAPTTASVGLKNGLITYFSDINVLTDEVRVYDGHVKSVDFSAFFILSRNADPGVVKAAVNDALDSFFNINNFDMGTGLYIANLYNTLTSIPGIRNINIFSPSDDILPTGKLYENSGGSSSGSSGEGLLGVAINELIVLGNKDIKFYLEPGQYNINNPSPKR